MKLTQSTTIKLSVSGIANVDPFSIYLEDFGPGAGKITITTAGLAVSRYWSHMGEQHNITSFFLKASSGYLLGKLIGDHPRSEVDDDKVRQAAVRQVLLLRRAGEIDKKPARELYAEVQAMPDNWREAPELLFDVFGDDWHCRLPQRPTAHAESVRDLIALTKQALVEYRLTKAEAA